MLAAFTKVEQLALDPEESKKLAEAITRVTEMYDVKVMSAEALAWTNLIMVAGGVYGPRMMSYSMDKKAAKQQRTQNPVTQMPMPRSAV